MAFSFNPLWKLLIDRNMTREALRISLSLSPSTMAKMSKGQFVSLEVLHKICVALNCQPADIVEYIPDAKENA